jgi:hypothetical protein
MKMFSVAVIVAILTVTAGILPRESRAHSPVSVGIAIGVPAPVAVYPPAYVYGPPLYGPVILEALQTLG